jgi:transposase IS200 family protein
MVCVRARDMRVLTVPAGIPRRRPASRLVRPSSTEHLDLLEDVFAKVCSDFGATLVESNGEDDHVHLLIEYPPTVAISALVNSLKGVPAAACASDSRCVPTGTTSGRRPTSPRRPAAHPFPLSGSTSKPSAGINMADAFSRLRAYARDQNLRLTDVAQAAIDGTLDPHAWAPAPPSTRS